MGLLLKEIFDYIAYDNKGQLQVDTTSNTIDELTADKALVNKGYTKL